MKTFWFTIIIFMAFVICLVLANLNKDSNNKENEIPIDMIVGSNTNVYNIVKIGNHQYLEHNVVQKYGIVHYEDCQYCKDHKGN